MSEHPPRIKIDVVANDIYGRTKYVQFRNIDNLSINFRGDVLKNMTLISHINTTKDIDELIEQLNQLKPNFQAPQK